MMLNPLPLTIAIGPYDHVRDVTDGSIPVEGVALRPLNLPIEEIFYRFTVHREWDISEMSMGKYTALVSAGDTSMRALPIFVSRAFRHSMFYVRSGSEVKRAEDLSGRRVGVPEWGQTAGVYARGYLAEHLGIDLRTIDWVQAGVNEPGRVEKVSLRLPEGIRYTSLPERSLNDLLLAGEIDAVVSARPPRALGQGIERLQSDYRTAEEHYFARTSIYPIMHALVVKGSVLDAHPWVAMNLVKAFTRARDQSLERLGDITASYAPMPWLAESLARARAAVGGDPFPYGIGQDQGGLVNRATLSAFCRFGHDQGLFHRLVELEELFPKNVLTSVKV